MFGFEMKQKDNIFVVVVALNSFERKRK